tara:strand:+ start:92 stop:508 length:417 start_codon:yes stop_codon:yes gene_type:complete
MEKPTTQDDEEMCVQVITENQKNIDEIMTDDKYNDHEELRRTLITLYRRIVAYYKNYSFITKIMNDTTKHKNGIFRRKLGRWLFCMTEKRFDTEEDEYQAINKYGRGIWNIASIKKSFTEEEQSIILDIARGYGAFDY